MHDSAVIWPIVLMSVISGCKTVQPEDRRPEVKKGTDLATPVTAARLTRRTRDCDFRDRHPLQISDWLSHGGVVKRVAPIYPADAKRKHLQGKISVRVLINKSGEVDQACGTGPPLLRDAAESAALQWIFRTPELNGEKTPYLQENLVFDFVLDESATPNVDR